MGRKKGPDWLIKVCALTMIARIQCVRLEQSAFRTRASRLLNGSMERERICMIHWAIVKPSFRPIPTSDVRHHEMASYMHVWRGKSVPHPPQLMVISYACLAWRVPALRPGWISSKSRDGHRNLVFAWKWNGASCGKADETKGRIYAHTCDNNFCRHQWKSLRNES